MTLHFTNKDAEAQKDQNEGYTVRGKFETKSDGTFKEHVLPYIPHSIFVSLPSLKCRTRNKICGLRVSTWHLRKASHVMNFPFND